MTALATGPYLGNAGLDLTDAQRRMQAAWNAYTGNVPDALKTRPGRPNDNVKLNLCKVTVNTGVGLLFGKLPTVQLDSTERKRTSQEAWVDAILEANSAPLVFQRLAINGSVTGHAFLKIVLDEAYPKLVVVDSIRVTVQTCPDNHTDVERYIITWPGKYDGKEAVFRQVIERSDLAPSADERDVYAKQIIRIDPLPVQTSSEEIPHWRIIDQVSHKDLVVYNGSTGDTKWKTLQVDIWEWDFPPIIDCQNLPNPNAFWGEADLEPDVIAMQMSINRSLSNINKILRLHAHPKTWTRGLSDTQLNNLAIDPEGVINLPSPDAELHNLEMTGDMASSLEYYRTLREGFHERVSIPEIAGGRLEGIGQLSGLALQILFASAIRKTETKQLTYGDRLFRETIARLLTIQFGYANELPTGVIAFPNLISDVNAPDLEVLAGGWDVKLDWPEILPSDPEQEGRVYLMDYQLGASKATLLEKRGYDPEKEAAARKLESMAAMEEQQEMMKTLAQGQVAGIDPFGRDRNASNGGADDEEVGG